MSRIDENAIGEVEYDPFSDLDELELTAPSSEAQQEIWAATYIGDDASCAYNESITLRFNGSLNRQAFEGSLNTLISRHESLRTTFSKDGLTLFVHCFKQQKLETIDLHDLPSEDQNNQLTALKKSEVETPFDLENGPLFRAFLVKLASDIHELILTVHHIVCDGWSMGVIISELSASYNAFCKGSGPSLEPAYAFSKYAHELQNKSESVEIREAESYWMTEFSKPIEPFDLPADRSRPKLKSYNADRYDHRIDAELIARLKKTASDSRTSFFSIMLSGFYVLLYRLTGKSDIVVGIPTAGQAVAGQSLLVGHCVNLLPIRNSVDGSVDCLTMIKKTGSKLYDGLEYQSLTFGYLLKKLAIQRDPSRLPLVSILFNLDRASTENDLSFFGLETAISTNVRSYENFELFVNASESKGAVVLECQFNTDLFDRETIVRWASIYEQILREIVRDARIKVSSLPVLTEQDRNLLAEINDTSASYPSEKRVSDLFEFQVENSGSAVAVYCAEESITYESLNRKANQLANYLLQKKVTGKLVGLCISRDIDMIAGVMGILKAGAAYVPLDPSFPKDRLAYMVSDSGLDTIIVNSETEGIIEVEGLNRVHLDDDREKISYFEDTNPKIDDVSPTDLAYVIYTSGSTGKPKGIELENRSVVNFLTSMSRKPGMCADDKVLAITTMSFDISVLEIFLPLTLGSSIVLLSKTQSLDAAAILDAVNKYDVTLMQATPTTWRMLLMSDWKGKSNLKALCGGEAITSELANELHDRVGELWNMYGPTETTVWSTCRRLTKDDEFIAIGSPIDNTQIYVMDEQLQTVPIGVTGELFIGGDGLARGYHNRPELTTERFIPNPLDPNGTRLYRTGDLAKITNSGELVCLGRTDFQVKIRGYRIELGEIENVLSQYPGVNECAVMVYERSPGDQRLVAYASTNDSFDAKEDELKRFVGKALPAYMVPAHFEWVESFPLTGSGKIDRKKLPAPVFDVETNAQARPINDTEKRISDIWHKVLGNPNVNPDVNFFDAGGHSLLVVEMIREIEKSFGIKISVMDFFEYPTIAQLAQIIENEGLCENQSMSDDVQARAQKRKAAKNIRKRR